MEPPQSAPVFFFRPCHANDLAVRSVFSLHVCFPFALQKYWVLPILVRLYRKRRKDRWAPGRHGQREKKQTGQAGDMEY